MRRPEAIFISHQEFIKAGQVVRHTAIWGHDDGRRPAHHMITAEKSVALRPGKAHVVAGVAWCVNTFQCPAVTGDLFAVTDVYIWNKITVNPFL